MPKKSDHEDKIISGVKLLLRALRLQYSATPKRDAYMLVRDQLKYLQIIKVLEVDSNGAVTKFVTPLGLMELHDREFVQAIELAYASARMNNVRRRSRRARSGEAALHVVSETTEA
jgi:hypothetical protein